MLARGDVHSIGLQFFNLNLEPPTRQAEKCGPGSPADTGNTRNVPSGDEWITNIISWSFKITSRNFTGSLNIQTCGICVFSVHFQDDREYHCRHAQIATSNRESPFWVPAETTSLAKMFRHQGSSQQNYLFRDILPPVLFQHYHWLPRLPRLPPCPNT